MNKVEKILNTICSRAALACAVISVAWVFVITAYIITRFFGLSWRFVEEFTGYWLVLIAYVPLAYALMTNTHIKIEIVTSQLSKKIRNILQVCTDLVALALTLYLVGRSVEWVIHGIEYETRASTASNMPLWPIYLIIPIGLTLFALVFTTKIGRGVMDLRSARGK